MKSTRNLGRRQFLRGAASASALCAFPAIIPASARGADGHVAPSNRIVMGAIGAGSKGTGDIRAFLGQPEVQYVAVCDVDKAYRERAKRLIEDKQGAGVCATYLDYRDLIARGDLDAVHTALPDHWHAMPAVAAARAGLDIYGQKPLARSIGDGRAICDAVRRYGSVWQTGSQQRSDARFRFACELVRNGRLGKILKTEVYLPNGHGNNGGVQGQDTPIPPPAGLDYDRWLGPAPEAPYTRTRLHYNWRWIMDYSGGQLTDWSGHHIDIAHWGLGLSETGPVTISGKAAYPAQSAIWNTPTSYRIKLTYASGDTIYVASRDFGPNGGIGVTWHGEEGRLYVTRGRIEADPSHILNEVIGPDEIHLYRSANHYRNFLDCVKSRKATICPAETGHRSISAGLLGEIAMLTGRTLHWDPAKEEFLNDPAAAALLGRSYREPWHI